MKDHTVIHKNTCDSVHVDDTTSCEIPKHYFILLLLLQRCNFRRNKREKWAQTLTTSHLYHNDGQASSATFGTRLLLVITTLNPGCGGWSIAFHAQEHCKANHNSCAVIGEISE
jgi:hypothetical protein